MKAIVCGSCVDIRALPPVGSVTCRCGNVTGWWTDPAAGTAKVYARDRKMARFLGFTNQYLAKVFAIPDEHKGALLPNTMRLIHESVTDCPGFVFDKGSFGCWAAIVPIGYTSDVSWSDDAPALAAPDPKDAEIERLQRLVDSYAFTNASPDLS